MEEKKCVGCGQKDGKLPPICKGKEVYLCQKCLAGFAAKLTKEREKKLRETE